MSMHSYSWKNWGNRGRDARRRLTRALSAQVYDGEWRQGRRHGQGSMQYDPCNHYSGEWRSGKKDGLGTMTYPDGAR